MTVIRKERNFGLQHGPVVAIHQRIQLLHQGVRLPHIAVRRQDDMTLARAYLDIHRMPLDMAFDDFFYVFQMLG